MKKTLIQLLGFVFIAAMAMGQAKDEDVLRYIQKYKDLAIAEQVRYNIPASIKLAQGILESSGGKSELALQAGNHFGIKCKSSWTGDTYYYDDDARQECFRKYKSAEESFLDHSQFLVTNKRYASLFDIHPVNYKDWAYQLKNCGYATNPKYAENLIRVIETYDLQDITLIALNQKEEKSNELIIPQNTNKENASDKIATGYAAPEPEMTNNKKNVNTAQVIQTKYQEPVQQKYYTLTTLHGIKGFYAKKGDMLLNEAIKHKIRYPLLLKINDLKDEPLPYDMFIYLDTKKKSGDRPHIIVKNNDNLHAISQQEGIQLAFLRDLNQLEGNEEPEVGETLYLQTRTNKKPKLRDPKTLEDVDITFNPNQRESDFIEITQESDPEEEPEDDGIVKEDESYEDDIMSEEEESVQSEEEEIVIEKPLEKNQEDENQVIKKQQEFRVVENEDKKPVEQKNSLEDLKRKMDRSVYSDANVTPISEEQKRKDLFSSNPKKEPQKENVIPKNNHDLNRPPKQNLSYNDRVSKDDGGIGNPNDKLVSHMKLVQTGMFPSYIPKSTGVEHTSAPVSTPRKVAPKKAAPKSTATKKNVKPTAKKKTTPANTKKTNVNAKKKTASKPAPRKKTTPKKK